MTDPENMPADAPTKTCPWCGVADVAVESEQCSDRTITGVDEDNGPVYWAECQRCGARSSLVGWAADAIPKWNERPAIPDPAGAMERASAVLEENMLQLKAAWQFLDALCKNDCSIDRMAARDRALAGYQFALKNYRCLAILTPAGKDVTK
jgi:hypothetical protein